MKRPGFYRMLRQLVEKGAVFTIDRYGNLRTMRGASPNDRIWCPILAVARDRGFTDGGNMAWERAALSFELGASDAALLVSAADCPSAKVEERSRSLQAARAAMLRAVGLTEADRDMTL